MCVCVLSHTQWYSELSSMLGKSGLVGLKTQSSLYAWESLLALVRGSLLVVLGLGI